MKELYPNELDRPDGMTLQEQIEYKAYVDGIICGFALSVVSLMLIGFLILTIYLIFQQ